MLQPFNDVKEIIIIDSGTRGVQEKINQLLQTGWKLLSILPNADTEGDSVSAVIWFTLGRVEEKEGG